MKFHLKENSPTRWVSSGGKPSGHCVWVIADKMHEWFFFSFYFYRGMKRCLLMIDCAVSYYICVSLCTTNHIGINRRQNAREEQILYPIKKTLFLHLQQWQSYSFLPNRSGNSEAAPLHDHLHLHTTVNFGRIFYSMEYISIYSKYRYNQNGIIFYYICYSGIYNKNKTQFHDLIFDNHFQ